MEQVEVQNAKNPSGIAQELKREAEKFKAFQDVCTVFALRHRTRAQVTVNSLTATMNKEGYQYDKDTCKDVLARMARLGLGKLHKDNKGRVRGLTDVKYTLQSIGLAAVGEKLHLAPFKKANRFSKLPTKMPNFQEAVAVHKIPQPQSATLVSTINGRQIHIPLDSEQFTTFLAQILEQKMK